jgi:hypothetical protein
MGPSQRTLPGNTEHTQETDFHVPGLTRTRTPKKRGAADPHLRPRAHQDRRCYNQEAQNPNWQRLENFQPYRHSTLHYGHFIMPE